MWHADPCRKIVTWTKCLFCLKFGINYLPHRGGWMIFHFSKSIFFFVNWISLYFFRFLWNSTILCLLLLYLDLVVISSSPVCSTVFPQGTSYGMWLLAWRRVDDFSFLIVQIHFVFLLIEFHCAFSISYRVLTCYIYYYCIWHGFKTLFSCFFALFLLFSPKRSVTRCDSSLGGGVYFQCTSFRVCIFISATIITTVV